MGNIDRRDFLKYCTFGAGVIAAGAGLSQQDLPRFFVRDGKYVYPGRVENWPGVDVKFSTCKQCHSDCGLMARVFNGTIVKLDGNPYHIHTTNPPIKYETPSKDAKVYVGGTFDTAKPYVDGAHSLCPRGQAGVQTVYDPYRVYMPLKRKGPRGSGQFEVISYEQLIDEVVNGGYLFKDVPGEETRFVEGFKQLWNNGQNRYVPANPDYPDFGPKTNQFVATWGRAEGGQNNLVTRFANALGSVNAIPHISACELSHHVATKATYDGSAMLKPDLPNSEFVLIFGANYYEANFPMQTLARRSVEATSSGKCKMVFIDPRGGNQIAHADYVPIKPDGDGAFAMGMLRWIIENKRYDENYLENPNNDVAGKNGEPSFSNASWLVTADEANKDYGKFIKDGDHVYVIDQSSKKTMPAPASKKAELWPTGFLSLDPVKVKGVSCLTSMQMLWKEIFSHSMEEYEKEAGISKKVMTDLAKEFTSHGKKAVADLYRGPVKHTNGYYNARAILMLNVLIGNVDWQGGYIAGGGAAKAMGGGDLPYDLGNWPASVKPSGVKISREGGSFYEETSEYKKKVAAGQSPFPAKRPWFPFGDGVWQEEWAGMYFQYPYPAKIFFMTMGNPAWSNPGHAGANDESLGWIKMIKDVNKVPLYINSDIVISESAKYADYIVPDTTYLEGWGMLGGLPAYATSSMAARQPVIEPMTVKSREGNPVCMENFLIDVAKRLGVPGFGRNAFQEGGDLNVREDYYLKMLANVAYDSLLKNENGSYVKSGPVPDANAGEMSTVAEYMKRYPRALKPEEWKKAAYVLARGGRFEDQDVAYMPWGGPQWVTHRWSAKKKEVQLYNEKIASTHNAITGERFNGTTILEPIRDMKGNLIYKKYSRSEYPLMLSTYKVPFHSKSRTMHDPWLLELLPGNFIEISEPDAKRFSISDGDRIKISSPTYTKGMTATARIRLTLRPGVITFSQAFGRWSCGSGTWYINGKKYEGDSARNQGTHLNALMLVDESIAHKDGWTVSLTDPVGGSMNYYDTPVKIEKV
ncbi:MAG: molybdopterin-dependent oxidoreductase [Nitrospiraceae bacterium]|nr:molybdopterin-dependent oxidoreductase [Nitrospiraceae bacterium]